MGFLEDRDFSDVPKIPEYYKGKTIFITGGSGFMGKVLIEKLLYSCTDLARMYLLLRSKKGVAAEDRLKAIYDSQCFDRLKRDRPGVFESKVFFIAGDVSEPGLGLSEEDRQVIANRVNIVFHVAASVRFDDPLKVAARLNLRGTRDMMALAYEIKNLEALIHVSTSYANTNRDPVEEVMYPPHANWRDTLNICENIDDHSLKVLTPKYLGELPNTYVFTKQLAEHVVYEQKGKLPIIILRPSIVISSVAEPAPGWVENFNGPVGIFVAGAQGILRSMYSDPNLIPDYMPVDIAIKGFIAAAWIRGTKKLEPSDDIPIYNCCSNNMHEVSIGNLIKMGYQIAPLIPSKTMLWNVGGGVTKSITVHMLKIWLTHLLPAILVDTVLLILRKKPMLVKIQRRIYSANIALEYYVTQQWTFCNKNFVALRSCLKKGDLNNFYYDMENIDKFEYFKASCEGGKKYLLKETDDDGITAKRHYRRMVILDKLVKCVFYGYLSWRIFNTAYVQSWIDSSYNMFEELHF
ncbi:putative fatty acyl-CoA reductase CG5065 [Epargyreus clarus]|uniref:putative fatty acyl-CoA reductase CG5065 n=1 Tax=Epargyreus clarus TaxID=520877 RepID=UPI003C2E028B